MWEGEGRWEGSDFAGGEFHWYFYVQSLQDTCASIYWLTYIIHSLFNIKQLGDPTTYGNMPPCPTIIKAITQSLNSPGIAAGYVNACGTPEARAAIASHHSASPDDVIVANGASGALELALTALLDEGSILLVPRPGFPLYGVIAQSHGASVVQYDLLPDREWECDLDHIESILIELDKRPDKENERLVRGILINNPSNPTGAVYSREHLMKVAQLAAKYRIPIISDEIYGDMTLNGRAFHPMADIVDELDKIVPVITASGIGKQCEFVLSESVTCVWVNLIILFILPHL